MRTFFTAGILMVFMQITACSSTPVIPNKGANLNTLEAYANYISSKNVCKKTVEMNINLQEKPFLLGAFDVRDGIASRVPTTTYQHLLDALGTNSSSAAPVTTEDVLELPSGLRTNEERLSYLTAQAIATSFGKSGIPVIPDSMTLGLRDAQTTDAPKISAAEEKDILKMIKEKIQQPDNDWAQNRRYYYIAEEKAFFASNITKPNVMYLTSGVQYVVLKKGNGKIPKLKNSITLNYKASLLDATEVDSSYKRKKPSTFKLSAMIPGVAQALAQVPEGSSLIIYAPAAQAYGEKGNTGVPPYAALVFEAELLSIKSGFFN